MFAIGDKVEVNGKKAIVLVTDENEVLVYFGHNFIKWVEKESLEAAKVA